MNRSPNSMAALLKTNNLCQDIAYTYDLCRKHEAGKHRKVTH